MKDGPVLSHELVLQTVSDAIIVIDMQGMILTWNRAAERIYGWSAEDVLGRPIADIIPVVRYLDGSSPDAVVARLVEHGGWDGQFIQPHRSGRQVILDGSARMIRDEAGTIRGSVAINRDITERKQAELERERLLHDAEQDRQEAEDALKVRNQFLSIASHELRTPLTPLLGHALVLQAGTAKGTAIEPEKLYAKLTTIVRKAEQLNALIEQLLDVSRLQRGQFALHRQEEELGALVVQSVEEFRESLPDAGARHSISVVRPETPVPVFGDAARLEEVLHNLLSNAVKYSPQSGQVEVRVARQGAEVVLEVRDQGIGIPLDAQPQLFEPFYRAGNVSPQSSGFGIGLYIVQQIVTHHDGRIEVQSTEGAGSRFRIVLPALDREAEPPQT